MLPPRMQDWQHLTLKEVAECEALAGVIVGQMPSGGRNGFHRRLAELLARRVRPLYDRPEDVG